METKHLYIDTSSALQDFCTTITNDDFITIDTEFIRENSYYPQICLIQIASHTNVAIIDPLAHDICLSPLYDLLLNDKIVKVMHSARQDMEAFLHYIGKLPKNIYDTQIAASVCGFGDSIGYSKIIHKLLKKHVDKSCRTSDWSQRPLSDTQIQYAISDVTYLREIYQILVKQIANNKRELWIQEELQKINNLNTYKTDINSLLYKIKLATNKPHDLARALSLVKLREHVAKAQNKPRKKILPNDCIANLAHNNPTSIAKLYKIRGIQKHNMPSDFADKVLQTLQHASNFTKEQCPELPQIGMTKHTNQLVYDMLKLALRYTSSTYHVSESLISSSSNLQKFILEPENNELLINHGWRKEIFGNIAKEILNENKGFVIRQGQVILIDL